MSNRPSLLYFAVAFQLRFKHSESILGPCHETSLALDLSAQNAKCNASLRRNDASGNELEM